MGPKDKAWGEKWPENCSGEEELDLLEEHTLVEMVVYMW